MNSQKDAMITRQALEQHTESEVSPWTLGNPMTTSKMESLSVLTVTSTDTWQRNADQRRKNKRPEHVLNVTKKDILPEIAKGSRR